MGAVHLLPHPRVGLAHVAQRGERQLQPVHVVLGEGGQAHLRVRVRVCVWGGGG